MNKNTADRVQDIHTEENINGLRTGRIVGIDSTGIVRVDYHGNIRGPLPARMGKSAKERLERNPDPETAQVLLFFEEGDPAKPVIFDLLEQQISLVRPAIVEDVQMDIDEDITIDGKSINFNAKDQIVLRCGKASITLTKAGKIIIRGAYLLNRSSGVNRIKGGSVQIN